MSTPLRFTFGLDALKQPEDHNLGENNSNTAIRVVVTKEGNNQSSQVSIIQLH